jgi:NADPH-ferrihemoprotein reductase
MGKIACSETIFAGRAFICGDGKSVSKSAEGVLLRLLGEAKGGSAEGECGGVAQLKSLKERSR